MPEGQDVPIRRDSTEKTLQDPKRRTLSRSPHPYHHQRADLPYATLRPRATFPTSPSPLRSRQNTDDEWSGEGIKSARSTESDSGTEADDEHFLKGLPAPKWRPHKGLRCEDGTFSGSPSPLVSPAILNDERGKVSDYLKKDGASTTRTHKQEIQKATEKYQWRRRTELGRRCTEVALLTVVGAIAISSRNVVLELKAWKRGLYNGLAMYPLLILKRDFMLGFCQHVADYPLSTSIAGALRIWRFL
jgi:hypothetical protein